MDIEIFVDSIRTRVAALTLSAEVRIVREDQVLKIDRRPPNILLYAELAVRRGFARNIGAAE